MLLGGVYQFVFWVGGFLFLVNVVSHLGHLLLQGDGWGLEMRLGEHGNSFSHQVCAEVEGYQLLQFDMTALHPTGRVSAYGSLYFCHL